MKDKIHNPLPRVCMDCEFYSSTTPPGVYQIHWCHHHNVPVYPYAQACAFRIHSPKQFLDEALAFAHKEKS